MNLTGADRRSLPYAPPSNVIGIIRRFRERAFPDTLDISVLTDIGIPEGNAHRTLSTLRFLGLVHNEGEPAESFEALRVATDEEYPVLLAGLVRHAYADVFKVVNPSKDRLDQIENHFRRYQPFSQRKRQAALFLGLCREAGMLVLDAPRERSTKQPVSGNRERIVRPAARLVPSTDRAQVPKSPAHSFDSLRTRYLEALIDSLKQLTAQGEAPPNELMDRIERLLEPDIALSLDRSDSIMNDAKDDGE